MSQIIQSRIVSVRRKNVWVSAVTGISAALGLFVILVAISMTLDWWLALSLTLRAALLSLNIAAVMMVLLYVGGKPIAFGPDDDEIALMVEDDQPAFRTRLIASVQLSKPGAVPAGSSTCLIEAMISQTESLAHPMDFSRVIRTDRMVKILAAALLIVVGGAMGVALGKQWGMDLLKRAFLSNIDVPRYTRVVPITQDLLIAHGDTIEIMAIADGVAPESGQAIIKSQGGERQTIDMRPVAIDLTRLDAVREAMGQYRPQRGPERDAHDKRVEKTLERLRAYAGKPTSPLYVGTVTPQQSFDYLVELNDGESARKYTARVEPRPAVQKVECKVTYPPYTGRGTEPQSLGQLTVPEGGTLTLAPVVANKPLSREPGANYIQLVGLDQTAPLTLDPEKNNVLSGSVQLNTGVKAFKIVMTDALGIKSRNPAAHEVRIKTDQPPTIKIVRPGEKVLRVRQGQVEIFYEAADDYALGKVELKLRVDDQPEQVFGPLDLGDDKPRSKSGSYLLKLSTVKPTTEKPLLEGSLISYWLEVTDTNTVSPKGPGVGRSLPHRIQVVTEEEMQAEKARMLSNVGGRLEKAAGNQEKLADDVRDMIRGSGVNRPQTQPVLPK